MSNSAETGVVLSSAGTSGKKAFEYILVFLIIVAVRVVMIDSKVILFYIPYLDDLISHALAFVHDPALHHSLDAWWMEFRHGFGLR